MKQSWPDAEAREAFVRDIETNFSLIAPAGVGKTYSIVHRVLEIARRDPENTLPRLVVVTYTRRAAGEMRDRIHAELLASRAAPHVFAAMDRAFFGTIHAFCARLLRSCGAYIGLPSVLDSAPDPAQLWEEFLLSPQGEAAIGVGTNILGAAARYVCIQELLATPPPESEPGWQLFEPDTQFFKKTKELFEPDFSELLSESRLSEARPNSRDRVCEGQRIAAQWLEKFRSGDPFLPFPHYSKGGKKFLAAWEAAFAPLQEWVQIRVRCALHAIALRYRQRRLEQGTLLYSDQIAFAAQLLKHPRAGAILRSQNLCVILDEAQDTDPLQFEVLFEISSGRTSMVGDPQQSIYGDRADLRVYQEFQRRLCSSPRGKELRYQTTFRCRSSILDFVNRVGPGLLHGEEGQVEFVPLQSACEGDNGQVLRAPVFLGGAKMSQAEAKWCVADGVATWLRRTELQALRARDWSEVAILCPRKRWLETLAVSLREQGFCVQIHSERSVLGDSSVYAWWTSLFWVLTHPTDSFEIVGLLREAFAVKDCDLAAFCRGDSSQLHAVASAAFPPLRLLGELAQRMVDLPLRSAVDLALRETRLLDRLLSLPAEDATTQRTRHIELLVQASDAEARGFTLQEFAQELRRDFHAASESPQVRPGAVQLITCQKAKGLEWDAVVVPYFHRKISFRSAEALVSAASDGVALLAGRIQEMQRLLYVTLTRARNTLVLLDDSALFPSASGETSKTFSFAQILGEGGLQTFEDLPQKALASQSFPPEAEQSKTEQPEEEQPEKNQPVAAATAAWLTIARSLAFHFPRKLTPHNITSHKVPHSEIPPPASENSGIRYGAWWHEAAEALPLQQPDWISYLEKILQKCPDSERGRREWNLFSQTNLSVRLSSQNYLLHQEMPFVFPDGATTIEGIMDLAAFHYTENNWLLVDWKTDRGLKASDFLERYHGQLDAYARCLRAMTGKKVEAGLYAASLGEWIPFEICSF